MVDEIHIIISQATAKHGILQLAVWHEGRGLFDSVTVATMTGSVTVHIRPDAFFILEDSRQPSGSNRFSFFLEADRSMESPARFRDTLRGYWNYLQHNRHTTRFGTKSCRIIIVTLTQERAQDLCTLVASMLPERAQKYFFFTSLQNFTISNPARVLKRI